MSRYSKSDYINREMAADSIVIECDGVTLEQARQALKDVPPADVKPVKYGRWLRQEYINLNNWATWRRCSCCGETPEKYFKGVLGYGRKDFPFFKYCPNCGARMDGGNNE